MKKVPLEIMNLPLHRDHCCPPMSQGYDAPTRTDKSKLIRLLEMIGKGAEPEQGRLPSEETGCVYEGSMDEDATHVLPTKSRDVERGMAVVDGMVILHKMQSTSLGTVVDLSHSFIDLLL